MDGTGGRHVCCACTCSEVLQKGACRVQVLFRRDAKQAAEPRKGMPCPGERARILAQHACKARSQQSHRNLVDAP